MAALPQIIDALRARGYQFVSIGDLIGKTRAEVMLPLSAQERFEARADGFIFTIFQWLRFCIATIFVVGIVLVSARALVIGILALIEKLRPDHAVMPVPEPAVTVLIPAHNEESVVVQTVTSVLASDVQSLRVIVVNDGSTDKTGSLLDATFGNDPRVRILHQVNRGKAASLHRALGEATDTRSDPDRRSGPLRTQPSGGPPGAQSEEHPRHSPGGDHGEFITHAAIGV